MHHKILSRASLFLLFCLCMLIPPGTSQGTITGWYSRNDETDEIISFNSNISVNQDSSLLVTEDIIVKSLGISIRHGIIRDFPIIRKGPNGKTHRVSFDIKQVTRDNRNEPYSLTHYPGFDRVTIGDPNITLEPGTYQYKLTYKTSRQIVSLNTCDELSWNVTGSGFMFPILKASATITLPHDISSNNILGTAQLVKSGSTSSNFINIQKNQNSISYSYSQSLNPSEILTILAQWPKNYISYPSRWTKIIYFFEDNYLQIISFFIFLIILCYSIVIYRKFGVKYKKTPIIPIYQPPDGISAAVARYLNIHSYDNKCFAASIVSMATKKYLTIQINKDEVILKKSPGDLSSLTDDEQDIAKILDLENTKELKFGSSSSNANYINRSSNNGNDSIREAKSSHNYNIANKYKTQMFITNTKYKVAGYAIYIVIFILANLLTKFGIPLVFSLSQSMSPYMFLYIAFIPFNIIASVIIYLLINNLITSISSEQKTKLLPATLNVLGIVSLTAIGAFLTLFAVTSWVTTIFIILPIYLILPIFSANLFHYTKEGEQLIYHIRGFQMYLSAVEPNRNIIGDSLIELFEKYFPYAIALGVERIWLDKFMKQFKIAQIDYVPDWYIGAGVFNLWQIGLIGSAISHATLSAYQSNLPNVSGYIGGGGGGSSGSSGGGGGLGGW